MNNSETAQLSTNNTVVGSFRMFYCFLLMIPTILGVIFSTYYLAVDVEHEQFRFPALSITGSALHYPQSISFRFGMGSGVGFFFLALHLIFFWIKKSAVEYGYHGCTYSKMYWPTLIAINGYTLMVATVDGAGTRVTKYQAVFHIAGATTFLLFLGFMMLNMTLICTLIKRKNRKFMKNWSFILKLTVTGGLFVYIVYHVGMMVREQFYVPPVYRDVRTIGNKIEWVFVVGCPVWMGSFFYELKDYRVRLLQNKSQQPLNQNKINASISGEVQPQQITATINANNVEDVTRGELVMKEQPKIEEREEGTLQ